MSGFSADWLALREPADAAARSARVTTLVAGTLKAYSPVRVVDLGCGSGSNLRYLSTRLPQPQDWLLIDNDPALLELADASAENLDPACVGVSALRDLSALDSAVFDERHLVTASALLDLVSEAWLADLVASCHRVNASCLAVLNYDGRIECTPGDDDDEWIRTLVNRHQRTDKGLGQALGPDAGARAEALLRDAGYVVVRETSDWVLDSDHEALQRQLIDGWAAAAGEIVPQYSARVEAWRRRRQGHVGARRSFLRVGHDDVAGVIDR